MPRVASFEELNRFLLEQCCRDDVRVLHGQAHSIGEAWKSEQAYFQPLPKRPFACCVTRQVKLTPYSQVLYETNRYSVPVEHARRELVLKVYAFQVEILWEQEVIATHARCYGRDQDIFDPLHYLALLEQRPGAFEYARPLRAFRHAWPAAYHRLFQRLTEHWPEGRGVKEFVRVLRLHQEHPAHLIEHAVERALEYGCVHADGVIHCLRTLQQPQCELPALDLSEKPSLAKVGTQPVHLQQYVNWSKGWYTHEHRITLGKPFEVLEIVGVSGLVSSTGA